MSALEVDFNSIQSNPFSTYKHLHNGKHTECRGTDGSWAVFKYKDVARVLKDFKCFSAIGVKEAMCPDWLGKPCRRSEFIVMQDPPTCNKNRKPINKLFLKKNIDTLIPLMRKEANELAKNFPKRGDFIEHFSYPYISSVLNEFLGTDFNFEEIRQWIVAIESITVKAPASKNAIESTIKQQRSRFLEIISHKRDHPSTDFISKIIIENGESLSNDDLLNIVELVVSAGYHTTIHLLSQIVLLLTKNKEIKKQLKESHELIPLFVHESLRLFPTVHFTMRQTVESIDMHGDYTIPKGAQVRVLLAAANRDPEVFSNPDEFDLFRTNNNENLTFGLGPHVCLGSILAHKEMCAAVEAIVNYFGDISLQDDLKNRVKIPSLLGFTSLNLTLNQ